MKKYNVTTNGINYTDCYFISNIKDYKEYVVELNNKFKVSESEIRNNETWMGHGHSLLTGVSGLLSGMIEEKSERMPMLYNLKRLHGAVLSDQLKDILDGKKLVINKNGGYFSIKKDQEFKVKEIKGKLYTEKDIKVKKWFGGNHYYAKIDNVDVVDNDGNVKWNSEQYAFEKAIEFMNELNKS